MSHTPPSFHQCLTAWKFSVSGKSTWQWPAEIQADSIEQFEMWQKTLADTKVQANKNGFACQFNKGGSKSGRCAAWVVSNGHTLKIAYVAPTKRKQAVTETSREAYKTVNLGERCEVVAREALRLGVCTDNEVARSLGVPPSSVSARRNNIEDAQGITLDGKQYALRMEGSKIDEVTGRRANTWQLVEVAEAGRQVSMF
jgi:hypothetical protein